MHYKQFILTNILIILSVGLLAQNLMPNPGFEDDTDSNNYPDTWWSRPYVSLETNSDYVHTGNKSIKITGGSGGLNTWSEYGALFNGDFPSLEDNTQYIMSCWVKSENLGESDFARMFHTSSPTPPAGYPTAQQTGNADDWTKIQTSFITLENGGETIGGNLNFGFDLSANAFVWIDDVSVIEVVPAVIELSASNTSLMADGNSFSIITAKVYDAYGNFLPVATNEIEFSLSGPGELIGANPNVCINGQTSITYRSGTETGTATITANSPNLSAAQISIDISDYGNDGVPALSPNYGEDVETEWWAYHQFNPESPNYNPNIISPEPHINVSTHSNNLLQAIEALPASGGTIVLNDGETYYVPATGISIEGKDNIHIISNGHATIKTPDDFTGIPRPGGGVANCMFQIMPVPGDWHDDNYANNEALANPARNFYFKNITFDGNQMSGTSLNFWATCDIVFDNCQFYGSTGLQEIHVGAWSNNIWIRGCQFSGSADHAVILDGTHGSGILNCEFEHTVASSTTIVFLSNDDCSRDVLNEGDNYATWQDEEIRLGNYIVVENCEFGVNSDSGKIPIASSARNLLVKNNTLLTGAYRFFNIGARCTQMTHPYPMPGYDYEFFDNRLVGNTVVGNLTEFARFSSSANTDCTSSDYTSDNQPNGSLTGWYQVRGNQTAIVTNDFIVHEEPNGNTIVGDNIVCGNCINNPDCTPIPYINCEIPEPSYAEFGCYTNAGPTYYLNQESGNDNNTGESPTDAWESFDHAINNISAASTLIIKEGVYVVDNTEQHYIGGDAAGISKNNATIIKAASGERVLITGDDGKPPRITLDNDFIRIEGIWFGGEWDVVNGFQFGVSGGGRVDSGREIIGCTFFGYKTIRGGLIENTFWQNNRFIRTGVANDPPMVYMSGDHGIGYGNNDVFDNNYFITGNGYAINGWHTYHNFVITRNFIGNVWGGFIGDGRGSEYQGNVEGSDHIVANNVFWNSGEGQGQGFNAATIIASNTHFRNNLLVDHSNIAVSHSTEYGHQTLENTIISHNAFLNVPVTHPGNYHITISEDNEENEIGVNQETVNNAINWIDNAFSQDATSIFNNDEINAKFEILDNVKAGTSSQLEQAGVNWMGGDNMIDIGRDISMPYQCGDDFKQAFALQEMRLWNSDGNMIFDMPEFTFSDGSGTTNYRGPETGSDPIDFKAIITPENASFIELEFLEFDTESGGDFVRIYDNSGESANLLGEYSGNQIPQNITSNTGIMVLHFQTNNDNNTGQGWKVQYSSDGSTDNLSICETNKIEIYPNPANDVLTIVTKNGSNVNFKLINAYGIKLKSGTITNHQFQLPLNNLSGGVYYLQFSGKGISETMKFIKL
jgi:hypothetical protein